MASKCQQVTVGVKYADSILVIYVFAVKRTDNLNKKKHHVTRFASLKNYYRLFGRTQVVLPPAVRTANTRAHAFTTTDGHAFDSLNAFK